MNELDLIAKYYTYNRIANSDGFYDSVVDLQQYFDIQTQEYPPGQTMWYWEIPKRWNVREAVLKDVSGKTIVDFQQHPLHLWAYSHPFSGVVDREELIEKHIFSNPHFPDYTPFRFRQMFRHWETEWGFSMPHNLVKALKDPQYVVEIDTYFTNDPMITFDYTSPGQSEDCIILFGHWCHHGLVEDGLSGCSVGLKVIDELRKTKHYFTYKFLGIPELIGAVAYLYHNLDNAAHFKAGLGLNFLGRDDYFVLYYSRNHRSKLDDALTQALKSQGKRFHTMPFKHSDERNYNPDDLKNSLFGKGTGDEGPFESPGLEIPTSSLIRRIPYKEYHTDHDALYLVEQKNLEEARHIILEAFNMLENDWEPVGCFQGFPCLSSPELQLYLAPPRNSNIPNRESKKIQQEVLHRYTPSKGKVNLHDLSTHLVYNLNTGKTILDLAEQFDVPFQFLRDYLEKWQEKGLVRRKEAYQLERNEQPI